MLKKRTIICFMLLIILLFIFTAINFYFGSIKYSPKQITNILLKKSGDYTAKNIVIGIRMPRIMAAIILGGALSLSGFLLQTFFSNPIAGPFVLGISSGAKMIVALTMIFSLEAGIALNSAILIISAFVGSIISMGFIILISLQTDKSSTLIISGIMIGYICSAVTDFVVTFADDSNILNLHNWSMGSFSGIDKEDIKIIAIVVFTTLIISILFSKQISAYQLGEVYAQNMGVNVHLFRIILILLSSVLSASVTAFAGPVSFVGIAVPHIAKNLFGTSKPQIIIPSVFLGGAVFCLFCDLIARTLFAPTELSISTVTAFFGAPVVIWIMISRNKAKSMY